MRRFTTGWEAELVANPTKNLTLRLGVSFSQRQRENFFNEVYPYFAQHIPQWKQAAAGRSRCSSTRKTWIIMPGRWL